MSGPYASRIEISRSALRHNLGVLRGLLGGRPAALAAVVKANAYGHGMLEAAGLAVEAGADWLAVDSLDEGERLRQAGFAGPILLLGYVPLRQLSRVVELGLRPTVFNLETLDALQRVDGQGREPIPVHLKLETGTHRQGLTEAELPEAARRLAGSARLRLEGVSTHYANIEDTTDHAYAHGQLQAFHRLVGVLQGLGLHPPIRHTACSAATLLFPDTYLEMVRVGIALYGLWPSRETLVSLRNGAARELDLRPVLAWKSYLAQVKESPTGTYVGYGCSYRTTRPSRLAVVPVGYYDGYDRGLSNVGHVLVRGQRAPVRGRVCMNMMIVDVTDVPGAGLEDEAVLIGRQGEERVGAEQLAALCGTIPYEVVSRLHPGIPRVVVE